MGADGCIADIRKLVIEAGRLDAVLIWKSITRCFFLEWARNSHLRLERIEMNAVMDFIRAASPWVAMGLLLAIFAARSARRKNGQKKAQENCGMEGMCLGMCLGTAIGTALGNNTGIGISLGMLIGLAIGSCMHKEDPEK